MRIIVPERIVKKYNLKEGDEIRARVDFENKKIKILEKVKK